MGELAWKRIAQRRRDAYLDRFRLQEPSVTRSVVIWVEFDKQRYRDQEVAREAARDLNLPFEGFEAIGPKDEPWKRPWRGGRVVELPAQMLEEIRSESKRLNTPMSTLVRKAWHLARETLRARPSLAQYAAEHR